MAKNKWLILGITTIASFMIPLDSSITNVAMPTIAETFNASFNLVALVPLFYLLALSVFMIPFGKLADIYGRKYFFISGLIIFTAASFSSGTSTSIHTLLISRFIQGVGAALLASTAPAIVTEAFPSNERGKALGITVASVYIGLTTGPLIGGLLVQSLGWEYIFFVNIPIGIIAVIASLIYIENIKEVEEKTKFNWIGAISLVIFLLSVFGITSINDKTLYSKIISLGIVALITFVVSEAKSKYPLVGLKRLVKNRMFVAANITALLNYIGLFAVSFLMSFYLIGVRELNPVKTGLVLVIMPLIMAMLSPIAGHLSDKIGSRLLSSLGMGVITFGLVMLSFISLDTSLITIGITLALIGVGMGLFSSPNTSAVLGSVEKYQLSIAASVLGTIRFAGQSLSITFMTLIISMFASSELMKGLISGSATNISYAKAGFIAGMHYTFIVFAIIMFLGVFTSLARSKIRKRDSVNIENI